MKTGDLVVYNDGREELIAEIKEVCKYSTMIKIEFAKKDYIPRWKWARHHELEIIDFSLPGENKVLTPLCTCGMIKVDKTAPRRAHSTWCDLHKS